MVHSCSQSYREWREEWGMGHWNERCITRACIHVVVVQSGYREAWIVFRIWRNPMHMCNYAENATFSLHVASQSCCPYPVPQLTAVLAGHQHPQGRLDAGNGRCVCLGTECVCVQRPVPDVPHKLLCSQCHQTHCDHCDLAPAAKEPSDCG